MDEQLLKTLLAEYAILSSSFDKHATVLYSILPLALTGIGGAAILGKFNSPYAGLGASLLLLLVVAWIGSSHTLLNRIGLRLIAIELRIRDGLAIEIHEEPFFFTSFIGQGAPGYIVYFSFFALVAGAALVVSMVQWWGTLSLWKVSVAWRITNISIPITLNAIGGLTIYLVEKRVERKRIALIDAACRKLQRAALLKPGD